MAGAVCCVDMMHAGLFPHSRAAGSYLTRTRLEGIDRSNSIHYRRSLGSAVKNCIAIRVHRERTDGGHARGRKEGYTILTVSIQCASDDSRYSRKM